MPGDFPMTAAGYDVRRTWEARKDSHTKNERYIPYDLRIDFLFLQKTKRKIMKNFVCSILVCLCVAACNQSSSQGDLPEGVQVINVIPAMNNLLDRLKLSDLGNTVRYVPLETSDSCLLTGHRRVTVNDQYILNGTQDILYSFDKETGQFIVAIGHRGEDPQGYQNAAPFYNEYNDLLYFKKHRDRLQKYDVHGRYAGQARIPASIQTPVSFQFSDSLIMGYHDSPPYRPNRRLLSIFTESGILLDSVLRPYPLRFPPEDTPGDIVGIRRVGGALLSYTMQADGTLFMDVQSFTPLWRCGKDIRLKEGFNDTVFTLDKEYDLRPAYIFNRGKWAMKTEDWQKGKSRDKLVNLEVLETPKKLFFQDVSDLYEAMREAQRQPAGSGFRLFNGIYDKQSGQVRMALAEGGIVDDLAEGPSFENLCGVSTQGEFIGIIQAHKVVSWLEEHPEAKDNPKLAPLLEVQEEDNPVMVIVSE